MASLLVLSGAEIQRHVLDRESTLVGRHPECHIQWDSNMISGRHARIIREGSDFFVEDGGSRNGTLVNGDRIESRVRLRHFDEVNFGHVVRTRFESMENDRVSLAERVENASTIKGTLSGVGSDEHLKTQTEAKLKAVLEISSSLAGVFDPHSVLPTILDTLFRLFPNADRGCILIQDDASGEMTARAVKHRCEEMRGEVNLSRTIVDTVLREKKGILSEDALSDAKFEEAQSIAALAIRSVMCVPLLGMNGEPMGIICIDSQNPVRPFRNEDLDVMMLVARQVGMSYESTRLLERYLEEQQKIYKLRRQAEELHQFFSPKVVEALDLDNADRLLEPRVTDVTVLFCDIRGFSRRAERSRHNLHELLDRCSQALGIMTNLIIEHGGVISDFQGDAALAFWGWPVMAAEGPLQACEAALAIHREFIQAQQDPSHELRDFHIGIGIAHGQTIAGKLGVKVQAKIGVFGPVVNLGSRLEGMTKELRVPILLDEATGAFVRENVSATRARCRRLAQVRPYGMDEPLTAYQLLPCEDEDPSISNDDIQRYESAVDAFTEGNWSLAFDLLDQLPDNDRAKFFLMEQIALQGYDSPKTWNGVYEMTSK